jgi:MFS family permease
MQLTHPASLRAVDENAAYRAVTMRCVPLLFTCFVLNYMDRTNIGFAQLRMGHDLGISNVQYGLGASIFFVSYSLFAVPSNLLMTRIGARRLISTCLFLWGLIAAGTMFIHTAREFYVVRFLLGVVESGFFPGVIYYFTRWYPSDRRANATGIFQSATVVAGIVSGVLSGALMTYTNGYRGLHGWQWMFLLEGLPSSIMGIIVLFHLEDEPKAAKWLSDGEKKIILNALEQDVANLSGRHSWGEALGDWKIYLLGLIFFLAVIGTYVLAFWQPAMIRGFGVPSIMMIGIYSTIPAVAAVIAKIWIGHHSDVKRELGWHFAVPALAGALGMLLMPLFPHNPVMGIACLTLATAGVHGCIPVFWSVPGLYLSGAAAAGGIALISTIGNTAGVVGPAFLGFIKSYTGSFDAGMYAMSGLLMFAAVLVLLLVPRKKTN